MSDEFKSFSIFNTTNKLSIGTLDFGEAPPPLEILDFVFETVHLPNTLRTASAFDDYGLFAGGIEGSTKYTTNKVFGFDQNITYTIAPTLMSNRVPNKCSNGKRILFCCGSTIQSGSTLRTRDIDVYNRDLTKTTMSYPYYNQTLASGILGKGTENEYFFFGLYGYSKNTSSGGTAYGTPYGYKTDTLTRVSGSSDYKRHALSATTCNNGNIIFAGGTYNSTLYKYVTMYSSYSTYTSLQQLGSPTMYSISGVIDKYSIFLGGTTVNKKYSVYTEDGVKVGDYDAPITEAYSSVAKYKNDLYFPHHRLKIDSNLVLSSLSDEEFKNNIYYGYYPNYCQFNDTFMSSQGSRVYAYNMKTKSEWISKDPEQE